MSDQTAPVSDAAAAESQPAKDQKEQKFPATSYADRLGDVSKWAVGAFAAVGGVAVTKLSLDRLGTGQLDGALVFWAYAGLVMFAAGVVAIVAAVIWHIRSGRVTIGYLLGEGSIARTVREFFNQNSYLLGGAEDLAGYRSRLTTLVKKRPLTASEKTELQRLIAAQRVILETGRAERARHVNGWATSVIAVGAILSTLGAATFALATNRDKTLREDRLAKEERDRAEVVSGKLLPKATSEVLLVVPEPQRATISSIVGQRCNLGSANGLLLEVASAPKDRAQSVDEPSVFHVVTERTTDCSVADLWVPPSWILPRPEKPPSAAEVSAQREVSGVTTTTTKPE